MSQAELTAIVNGLIFVTFTCELVIAFVYLLVRVREYRRAHWKQPYLIRRELALIGGLAWPILLISAARVFHWEVQGILWWSLITGVPACLGIGYWIYAEWRLGRFDR